MITKTHGATTYSYEVVTGAHMVPDTGEWIATLREVGTNVTIHVKRGSREALQAVLDGKAPL